MIIVVCDSQSLGTTDTHRLFNAEHTSTILSIVALCPGVLGFTKSIGTENIKIQNLFLVAPITRSMCIRTLARCLMSNVLGG